MYRFSSSYSIPPYFPLSFTLNYLKESDEADDGGNEGTSTGNLDLSGSTSVGAGERGLGDSRGGLGVRRNVGLSAVLDGVAGAGGSSDTGSVGLARGDVGRLGRDLRRLGLALGLGARARSDGLERGGVDDLATSSGLGNDRGGGDGGSGGGSDNGRLDLLTGEDTELSRVLVVLAGLLDETDTVSGSGSGGCLKVGRDLPGVGTSVLNALCEMVSACFAVVVKMRGTNEQCSPGR